MQFEKIEHVTVRRILCEARGRVANEQKGGINVKIQGYANEKRYGVIYS